MDGLRPGQRGRRGGNGHGLHLQPHLQPRRALPRHGRAPRLLLRPLLRARRQTYASGADGGRPRPRQPPHGMPLQRHRAGGDALAAQLHARMAARLHHGDAADLQRRQRDDKLPVGGVRRACLQLRPRAAVPVGGLLCAHDGGVRAGTAAHTGQHHGMPGHHNLVGRRRGARPERRGDALPLEPRVQQAVLRLGAGVAAAQRRHPCHQRDTDTCDLHRQPGAPLLRQHPRRHRDTHHRDKHRGYNADDSGTRHRVHAHRCDIYRQRRQPLDIQVEHRGFSLHWHFGDA